MNERKESNITNNEKPWHCCVHSKTGKSLIQEKEVLTFILAGIGGFCDTITFLKGNHTFSGHITGNIVVFFASYFGSPLSESHDVDYIHLLIIPQFAICVALAARIVYRFGPELLLLLMGLILCIAGLIPFFDPDISPYVPSLIAVVAMAFQNAFNDLHQSAVHMKTTIVTGTLTRISLVLSNMLCFGTCMNSIFGEPKYIQSHKNNEVQHSLSMNQYELYVSNNFLLNDEYFEPNPILFRETTLRNKVINQTKQKAVTSTSKPNNYNRPKNSQMSITDIMRQSDIRSTLGLVKRDTKMIDLPAAATYHYEDLCGPSLGMIGFVAGCALGSFMGVYFDLRGLLLPGVILLLVWIFLHFYCSCPCIRENTEEDNVENAISESQQQFQNNRKSNQSGEISMESLSEGSPDEESDVP